ncbi:PIG-L family deacetylase [Candidatus Daviesbacteria bacterium]|nr:PIG-L family deacetylase [Candidatus Daviesbacteria bacterium]
MKALFIFAHPDDETFSSGGTIARLAQNGVKVHLICATRGEAGTVGDPPLTTPDKLGEFREKELKKAAKILGISRIFFLNFIDGTLNRIPLKKLLAPITRIIDSEQPDLVVTFDKRGGSNHPDHKAISKATTLAFTEYARTTNKHVCLYHTAIPRSYLKKYEQSGLTYTAFGKIKGVKDEDITTYSHIVDTYKIKVRAAQCHQTQRQDWQRFLKRAEQVNLKVEFFRLIFENSL